jgi:hypothetical protein
MTIDQFNQAKRIEEEVGELMHCLKCCKAAIGMKQTINVTPSAELPQDISDVIMAKAIELLTERIKELEEEFKKL